MKALFDTVSFACSVKVTKAYSTSFSSAVKMLAPSIRQDIYNIYGFVRFADEIVDSFHDYNKEVLFEKFENELEDAIQNKISLNPILNSFQHTVNKHNISQDLIDAFMKSMKLDLVKQEYKTTEEYHEYIYGSADVVGLMCLMVFVNGDEKKYEELKASAMKLGSAFQKVNFLRDIKADFVGMERMYFPNCDFSNFTMADKQEIEADIQRDFDAALVGIKALPVQCRFGVYVAFKYYYSLFKKIKRTKHGALLSSRIRIPDYGKLFILFNAKIRTSLNLL